MASTNLLFRELQGNALASAIAGGAILAFLAVIVFLLPEPTEFQRKMLRFFIATGAALFAYFFVGGIALQGTLGGAQIGAGGGFALFVLIMFVFDPLKVQTVVADSAPRLVPPRQEIKKAQGVLSELGLYSGETNGVPTSATRKAIAAFQEMRDLPVTGYIEPQTANAFVEAERATSTFEGTQVTASEEQKAFVGSLLKENGLRSSIATKVLFDTLVNMGPQNTRRLVQTATDKAGGNPVSGVSEKQWLLALIEARRAQLQRVLPQFAANVDKYRLQPLQREIEALTR